MEFNLYYSVGNNHKVSSSAVAEQSRTFGRNYTEVSTALDMTARHKKSNTILH